MSAEPVGPEPAEGVGSGEGVGPVGPGEGVGPVGPDVEPDVDAPAEDRRYPSTIGGAFYLLVLAAAAVAIFIVSTDDWRVGVRVLGVALAAAGALRLVLPQRDAGMLAVRHRLVDVVLLVGVAGALWFLAGDIPDQPPR